MKVQVGLAGGYRLEAAGREDNVAA